MLWKIEQKKDALFVVVQSTLSLDVLPIGNIIKKIMENAIMILLGKKSMKSILIHRELFLILT